MLEFIFGWPIGFYVGPILVNCLVLYGIYELIVNLPELAVSFVENLPEILMWLMHIILSILSFVWDCILYIVNILWNYIASISIATWIVLGVILMIPVVW